MSSEVIYDARVDQARREFISGKCTNFRELARRFKIPKDRLLRVKDEEEWWEQLLAEQTRRGEYVDEAQWGYLKIARALQAQVARHISKVGEGVMDLGMLEKLSRILRRNVETWRLALGLSSPESRPDRVQVQIDLAKLIDDRARETTALRMTVTEDMCTTIHGEEKLKGLPNGKVLEHAKMLRGDALMKKGENGGAVEPINKGKKDPLVAAAEAAGIKVEENDGSGETEVPMEVPAEVAGGGKGVVGGAQPGIDVGETDPGQGQNPGSPDIAPRAISGDGEDTGRTEEERNHE